MFDRLLQLASSTNRLTYRFLGLPESFLTWDEKLHASALRKAERVVYGLAGLAAYEGKETRELHRLTRRSAAQFCARESFYPPGVRAVRFVLGFGLLATTVLNATMVAALGSLKRPSTPSRADVAAFQLPARLREDAERLFPGKSVAWPQGLKPRWRMREIGFFWRAVFAYPAGLRYPNALGNFLQFMGRGAHLLDVLDAEIVLVSLERSPASSLLTAYIRSRGKLAHNIMHGEHFFGAHNCFCEFDVIHCWGRHFQECYARSLCRAEYSLVGCKFHQELIEARGRGAIASDKTVLMVHSWVMDVNPKLREGTLRFLLSLDPGWRVVLRGHPTGGDRCIHAAEELTKRLMEAGSSLKIVAQLGAEVALSEVLTQRPAFFGAASTVLLEAWVAGCKVIYQDGTASSEAYMPRFQGSPNVMLITDETSEQELQAFLSTGAVFDEEERKRVDYLTKLPDLAASDSI